MTIVNAFNAWRRASDNPGFVRTFCRKNFLSHQVSEGLASSSTNELTRQNLQQIEELRQQLIAYLVDSGFIVVTPEQQREISQ